MAKIDFNASDAVKAILPDLIDYAGFTDYLEALPFQSYQMLNKQTLRVQDKDLDDIVKIKSSITSYIDKEYYSNIMLEQPKSDKDSRNYPVRVEAMRCNWIFESYGKRFFQKILMSEQLEIYSIPAIRMFIDYLYIYVKEKLLGLRLWPYFVQLVIYYALVYIYEA